MLICLLFWLLIYLPYIFIFVIKNWFLTISLFIFLFAMTDEISILKNYIWSENDEYQPDSQQMGDNIIQDFVEDFIESQDPQQKYIYNDFGVDSNQLILYDSSFLWENWEETNLFSFDESLDNMDMGVVLDCPEYATEFLWSKNGIFSDPNNIVDDFKYDINGIGIHSIYLNQNLDQIIYDIQDNIFIEEGYQNLYADSVPHSIIIIKLHLTKFWDVEWSYYQDLPENYDLWLTMGLNLGLEKTINTVIKNSYDVSAATIENDNYISSGDYEYPYHEWFETKFEEDFWNSQIQELPKTNTSTKSKNMNGFEANIDWSAFARIPAETVVSFKRNKRLEIYEKNLNFYDKFWTALVVGIENIVFFISHAIILLLIWFGWPVIYYLSLILLPLTLLKVLNNNDYLFIFTQYDDHALRLTGKDKLPRDNNLAKSHLKKYNNIFEDRLKVKKINKHIFNRFKEEYTKLPKTFDNHYFLKKWKMQYERIFNKKNFLQKLKEKEPSLFELSKVKVFINKTVEAEKKMWQAESYKVERITPTIKPAINEFFKNKEIFDQRVDSAQVRYSMGHIRYKNLVLHNSINNPYRDINVLKNNKNWRYSFRALTNFPLRSQLPIPSLMESVIDSQKKEYINKIIQGSIFGKKTKETLPEFKKEYLNLLDRHQKIYHYQYPHPIKKYAYGVENLVKRQNLTITPSASKTSYAIPMQGKMIYPYIGINPAIPRYQAHFRVYKEISEWRSSSIDESYRDFLNNSNKTGISNRLLGLLLILCMIVGLFSRAFLTNAALNPLIVPSANYQLNVLHHKIFFEMSHKEYSIENIISTSPDDFNKDLIYDSWLDKDPWGSL